MNKLFLLAALIMMTCTSHAEVYTWTDSQGVVHFSDNPHPGAEKLKIPDDQSFSTPSPSSSSPKQEVTPVQEENNTSEKSDRTYTKIAIRDPLNQATIRNNQGYVVVSVELEPKLSEGDNLQILFDGAPLGDPQPNTIFELNGIYRGSHTIAVQVVNANGEVLLTSDPITIFMQRPRVGMAH
ncbi:DUF4124 domain-containing protein [Legionella maioricensis]|uniref:DUF4124 domain-containing protein n=1 Tax=Legionella maioricensis TaxID=2896528 RepID=A0A9X2IDC3_9GAMM|nr:DUF4124 domain-containing protein [Legionella maioricensis]MCL9684608.1 DUF4124 domain-containing protein [Legionella maioricensis]MCL9687388.1 DUF4124 domain-containing protein [Legionella maioricensis]